MQLPRLFFLQWFLGHLLRDLTIRWQEKTFLLMRESLCSEELQDPLNCCDWLALKKWRRKTKWFLLFHFNCFLPTCHSSFLSSPSLLFLFLFDFCHHLLIMGKDQELQRQAIIIRDFCQCWKVSVVWPMLRQHFWTCTRGMWMQFVSNLLIPYPAFSQVSLPYLMYCHG